MSSFCRSVASLLFFCYKKPISNGTTERDEGTKVRRNEATERRSEAKERKSEAKERQSDDTTERGDGATERQSEATILLFFCYGLTTPNAAPIEIHVNCLNSMGRFHPFSTISTYSVAYHDKTWSVPFKNRFDICLVTRQILSYSPWRV